jgi:hypothetical protein
LTDTQILNCVKTRSVGASLFHADQRTDAQTERQTDGPMDGRTDMTKPVVAFCSLRTRLIKKRKENMNLDAEENMYSSGSSVFWDVTKHLRVFTGVSGLTIGPIFNVQAVQKAG